MLVKFSFRDIFYSWKKVMNHYILQQSAYCNIFKITLKYPDNIVLGLWWLPPHRVKYATSNQYLNQAVVQQLCTATHPDDGSHNQPHHLNRSSVTFFPCYETWCTSTPTPRTHEQHLHVYTDTYLLPRHAHTQSAPHVHTHLSVLTCPLQPIYPSSLLYTVCVSMYSMCGILCVCAFPSALDCPGKSFPNELSLPPTPFFHTYTHTLLIPWFLHTVAGHASPLLAGWWQWWMHFQRE